MLLLHYGSLRNPRFTPPEDTQPNFVYVPGDDVFVQVALSTHSWRRRLVSGASSPALLAVCRGGLCKLSEFLKIGLRTRQWN